MKPRADDLALAEVHEQPRIKQRQAAWTPPSVPDLFAKRPIAAATAAALDEYIGICRVSASEVTTELDHLEKLRITPSDSFEEFSRRGERIKTLSTDLEKIGSLIVWGEEELATARSREKAQHDAQKLALCNGELKAAATCAGRMDARRRDEIADVRELLQHLDGALAHAGANRGRLQARVEEALSRYLSVTAEAMKPLHFPGIARIAEFAFSASPLHREGDPADLSFASAFKRLAGDDPTPDDDKAA